MLKRISIIFSLYIGIISTIFAQNSVGTVFVTKQDRTNIQGLMAKTNDWNNKADISITNGLITGNASRLVNSNQTQWMDSTGGLWIVTSTPTPGFWRINVVTNIYSGGSGNLVATNGTYDFPLFIAPPPLSSGAYGLNIITNNMQWMIYNQGNPNYLTLYVRNTLSGYSQYASQYLNPLTYTNAKVQAWGSATGTAYISYFPISSVAVTSRYDSLVSYSNYNSHVTNSNIHITALERINWNNKAETTITNGLASINYVNGSVSNLQVTINKDTATEIIVDAYGKGDFSSISQACVYADAVHATNATLELNIRVAAGTYTESPILNLPRTIIRGDNRRSKLWGTFTIRANPTYISGMYLRANVAGDIPIVYKDITSSTLGTLQDCYILNAVSYNGPSYTFMMTNSLNAQLAINNCEFYVQNTDSGANVKNVVFNMYGGILEVVNSRLKTTSHTSNVYENEWLTTMENNTSIQLENTHYLSIHDNQARILANGTSGILWIETTFVNNLFPGTHIKFEGTSVNPVTYFGKEFGALRIHSDLDYNNYSVTNVNQIFFYDTTYLEGINSNLFVNGKMLATTNFVIDIVNSIPNVDVTKIYNPSNFNIWLDGNEDKWLVYSVTNSGKWLLNFSDNTLIGGVHPSDLEFNFGSFTTNINDIYYQINGPEVLVSKDAGQMFNNVPFPSILNNVNVIGTGRVDYSISIITSKIDKIVMHSELFGITNGYVSIYYVNEATNQVLFEAKAYADLVTNGLPSFTYVDEATNQVLIDAKSYTDLATNNLFVSKLYAPGDLSQWINGLGEVWRSTTGNIGPSTNAFISVDFKALNGTVLSQTVYEWPFNEGDFWGTYTEGDGYYIDYLGTPTTTWYAEDLPLPRTLTVFGHPECGTATINLAMGSTTTNYDYLAYKSDLLPITNGLATTNYVNNMINYSTTNMLGNNIVLVKAGTNAIENGNLLLSLYEFAKTLTPNNEVLSVNNRVTILLTTGIYDLQTISLNLNTQYVDIINITQDPKNVLITGSINNSGLVVQSANDVTINGITIRNTVARGAIDGFICSYRPLGDYPLAVLKNCIFDGSVSWGTACDAIYNGTFINCIATGQRTFGGWGAAQAKGTFIDCTANDASIGGWALKATGYFKGCKGGGSSFGNVYGASGTFIDCSAGAYSFGGQYGGTSGTFDNCVGGGISFGTGGTISSTARLYNCRIIYESDDNRFGTPQPGAIIRNCIGSRGTLINYPELPTESHMTNLFLHVTLNDKTNWNNKADSNQTFSAINASSNYFSTSIYNTSNYFTDIINNLSADVYYVLPTVSWVSSSAGTYEIGTTNTSVNLSFNCNKSMTTRNYSNAYVASLGAGSSYTFTLISDIYVNKTYTITVVDSKTNSATASQVLTFTNRKYYGVSSLEPAVIPNATIIGLTKTWQARGNAGTAAPADQYIYVCYPTSLGPCTSFSTGGFTTSPWSYVIRSVTNSSNYAENFYIYKTDNKLTSGAITYDIH